jgi:hypothetical protein
MSLKKIAYQLVIIKKHVSQILLSSSQSGKIKGVGNIMVATGLRYFKSFSLCSLRHCCFCPMLFSVVSQISLEH